MGPYLTLSASTSGDGTIGVEKSKKGKAFRKLNSAERLDMLGLPQTEFWGQSMAVKVIYGDVNWLMFPKEMKRKALDWEIKCR